MPARIHIQVFELVITGVGDRVAVMLLAFEHLRLRPSVRFIQDKLEDEGVALDRRLTRLVLIDDCKVYSRSKAQKLSQAHQHLYYWPFLDPPQPIEQVLIAFARLPRSSSVSASARPNAPQAGPLPPANKSSANSKKFDAGKHDTKPSAKPATSEPPATPAAPTGRPGEVVILSPVIPQPDPGSPVDPPKSPLQRYSRPEYAPGISPLLVAPLGTSTVFAIEEVQCSEEGNWLVGFLGILQADGRTVNLILLQRHALNNYPGEGLPAGQNAITVQELSEFHRTRGYQFYCDPDWRECASPDTYPYPLIRKQLLTHQRLHNGANPDWARHLSCRPDTGVCSRERYRWHCDVKKRCVSYDSTRWWCAERREFCFSRVKFGDWASAHVERETIEKLNVHPSTALIYDMAHGLVPIAQEALTRTCGSGASSGWKSAWARRS